MNSDAHHGTGPTWNQLPDRLAMPDHLRALLRAQRRAAEAMPYRLTGAPRVDLSTIYVRQRLGQRSAGKDRDRERDRAGDRLETGAQVVVDTGIIRDLGEALDLHRDLLITGGPGAGKSTLTLQLAGDLASAWLGRMGELETRVGGPSASQSLKPLVPLRVSARNLITYRELGWLRALATAAAKELQLSSELSAQALAAPVFGAPWLILVDALDEIIDEGAYRDLLGMLAEGMAGQFPHRFVITSRPMASGDEIKLSEVGSAPYALESFDQPALSLFAQRWFSRTGSTGAGLAERFLAQVRSPGLREVVTVPLLATVAAIVFEQAPDRSLPARRYHLYEAYLRYLFSGRDEAFIHQWPRLQERLTAMPRGAALAEALRDGRLQLAETLAVQWLETGRVLADVAADWLRDAAEQVGVPRAITALDVREMVLTVAMTTGLFARADEDIFFLHRSLAEHLAASVYARRLPHPFTPAVGDWLDWLDRAAMSELPGLPHSALAAYTWSHPNDDVIGWLQRQDAPEYRQIAGQLIAHGARTPPDAVAAFCADFSNRPGLTGPSSSITVFTQSMAALVQLLDYPEAIIALRRVALDDRVSVERRLDAAAALVNAGPSHASQGMEFFRQVLCDSQMKPQHRIRAARMVPSLPIERKYSEVG